MLVGGGVEHHLWAQRAEDLVDSARFGDVGQNGMKRHGGRTLGELVVDVEQAVLVAVEQPFRPQGDTVQRNCQGQREPEQHANPGAKGNGVDEAGAEAGGYRSVCWLD